MSILTRNTITFPPAYRDGDNLSNYLEQMSKALEGFALRVYEDFINGNAQFRIVKTVPTTSEIEDGEFVLMDDGYGSFRIYTRMNGEIVYVGVTTSGGTVFWANISNRPLSSVNDIDDAVSKKHAHSNKTVLDTIQEALTTVLKNAYDGAVLASHGHLNKSTLDAIQEAFTTALKSAYDGAVSASHGHSNKSVLDNIQEAFTSALKSAYDGAVSASHSAASMQNVGSGSGLVYKGIDGQLFSLRTIKAGTNVSVVNNTNDIEISASGGSGGGDVTGPDGAISGNIVLFDGTTGKIIKDSGVSIGSLAIQFVDDVEDLPESPNVDDLYWIRNDKNIARYNGEDWDFITEERFTSALKSAYDGAVSASHSHSNKSTLDAIQEALTTVLKSAYDGAVSNSHTHTNKTELDKVSDGGHDAITSGNPHNVTKSDVGLGDVPNLNTTNAVNNQHTHSNKATLDSVQEALTTALKGNYDGAYTHSGLTTGNPHSVTKSDVGLGNVTNDAQVKSADKASQGEAEAGTDDTKWMTPLKTKQAIEALGGSSKILIVVDQKSAGTQGGTFTSGAWRTRDLNTVRHNTISGASLASNQITLPAGTYKIRVSAPAFYCLRHKAKLRNITDSEDTVIGQNDYNHGSYADMGCSFIEGVFTIAGEKVFEVQHRCDQTRTSDGFGLACDFGVVEVYTIVEIQKIA